MLPNIICMLKVKTFLKFNKLDKETNNGDKADSDKESGMDSMSTYLPSQVQSHHLSSQAKRARGCLSDNILHTL